MWDDNARGVSDVPGEALTRFIADEDLVCLNDGRPTRVNRVTSGVSAPDVCLVHPSMLDGTSWRVLPLAGSDHNPIRTVVEVNTVHIREDESKLEWN